MHDSYYSDKPTFCAEMENRYAEIQHSVLTGEFLHIECFFERIRAEAMDEMIYEMMDEEVPERTPRD